jgi:DNA-binding transcriptional ArsR family regulator
MSMPAISRHLKVLETAGLIERDRVGQSRPSRLRVEALEEAARWVVWQSRIDRLEQHLKEMR